MDARRRRNRGRPPPVAHHRTVGRSRGAAHGQPAKTCSEGTPRTTHGLPSNHEVKPMAARGHSQKNNRDCPWPPAQPQLEAGGRPWPTQGRMHRDRSTPSRTALIQSLRRAYRVPPAPSICVPRPPDSGVDPGAPASVSSAQRASPKHAPAIVYSPRPQCTSPRRDSRRYAARRASCGRDAVVIASIACAGGIGRAFACVVFCIETR